MLKNIEAVIFDLDGTLVDSMWMWEAIDVEYLGRFGISMPEDLQACIEGMSFSETAVYFKERFDIPEPLEEIKKEWNRMAWDKYAHEVPFKKGAMGFLKYLKKRGIKTGIATSNSKELVETVIGRYGAEAFFDSIHTACEVPKGKPAPDIYELVATELQVAPENCLVFEDVVQGIMAGKNAGMKVCSVYDDFSKDMDERKRELSDYYIHSYEEIPLL
ncbi:HAD family hydrolase [Acetivibrio ethanolgignens]|uniref:HAD family hydrolase n=1 Tax=Acetivibrio ethanolgignens TaxID=290052 RepID=A0A0V8QHR0_9FIRM|nr:HAD family phosphatase [Acetivibrio ethanolgignens]KSV60104.1 HAD family hydrolase [Acetivibrio ethanolgignens]